MQTKEEIENWHKNEDPWQYKTNPDDEKRLNILLEELPKLNYNKVLDIGCGQGFITKHLPGDYILGVDISEEAIKYANTISANKINFKQASIFNLNNILNEKFNLIVITGVLYPQYIGKSSSLIYYIIDNLLANKGVLVTVHIDDWYNCQFPYLKLKQRFYSYRNYNHKLEIYSK